MNLSVELRFSAWLYAALAVLLIVFVLWSYRRTTPPISRRIRALLITFRCIALLMLLSLIFDLHVFYRTRHFRRPVFAFLVDQSASLTLKEKSISRQETVLRILENACLDSLQTEAEFKWFGFSDSLYMLPDTLAFNQQGTDLAGVVESLSKSWGDQIQGAVIVSDGQVTQGENPAVYAETLPFPLFTIGVGYELPQKDIKIAGIHTLDAAYAGDKIPVDVTVRGTGYDAGTRSLYLMAGQDTVAVTQIPIPVDGQDVQANVEFIPEQTGLTLLTAQIEAFDGEQTAANNRLTHVMNILNNRTTVLLVSGAPSPDAAFIKKNLESDKNITLIARTLKTKHSFYQGPVDSDSLNQVNCCVFVDLPDAGGQDDIGSMIGKLIKNGVPFFSVWGCKGVDLKAWQKADAFFPVVQIQTGQLQSLYSVWPVYRQTHAVTRFMVNNLKSLPPLTGKVMGLQCRSESIVLIGSQKENGGQGPALLIAADLKKHKRLVLTAGDLYRWDFGLKGQGFSENGLKPMFSQGIRWLVTQEKSKFFAVKPEAFVFPAGQDVSISAQWVDDAYRPVTEGQVNLQINSETYSGKMAMTGGKKGLHSIRIPGLDPGRYRVFGEALMEGRRAAIDSCEFVVAEQSVEFMNPKPNLKTLKQMAAVSGGKFIDSDSLHLLKKVLPLKPRRIQNEGEFLLRRWSFGFILLFFLFSFEWLIRKRKGLL